MHDDGTFATAPLSFELAPGDRVLVRGRSGAGKSTLLSALAGVCGQSGEQSGQLFVNGREPERQRGRIGFVLQDPYSQAVMERVGDDVAFGLENIGVKPSHMRSRIEEVLAAVGLNIPFDHPTESLSGGERQRLALAGVLALRPSLLLLDEPTANLDPQGARLIRDTVARISRERGITLVVVDHHPELWAHVVTREFELDERGITEVHGVSREVSRVTTSSARDSATSELNPAGASTRSTLILRARDLSVGYPHSRAAQCALDIDLAAGEILAITGANGVGKSALALTLGGLIPPMHGEVCVTAPAPSGPPHTWKSRDVARNIGSVFQAPEHQFIGSTVRRDIELGMSKNERRESVDATLAEFNLAEQHEQNPFTLSGGEKRRLSIADAVVTRPRILIFDEPTFGQDEDTRRDLVTSLRRLRDAGHAIVVMTHDERFVVEVADRHLELVA